MAGKQTEGLEDQQVRQSLQDFIAKNFTAIASVFIGIVLIVAAYLGYGYMQTREERIARESLYEVESRIEKIEKDLYEQALKETSGKDEKTPGLPEIEHTPENFEKHFATAAQDLEARIEEHRGTESAALSTGFLADLYSEYKLDDRALALLEKMQGHVNTKTVVGSLLKMQLAGLMSTRSQCEKAVDVYSEIAAANQQPFLMPQVLLRRAACYIQMGQAEKAKSDLDRLEKDFPESEATKSAQVFERLLLTQKKVEK